MNSSSTVGPVSTLKFIYLNDSFDRSIQFTVANQAFLPSASFSALTCSINILVFANPALKDPAFKFLLLISVSDFAYMFLSIFQIVMVSVCGLNPVICGSTGQFIAQFLYSLVVQFATGICALFSITSEIFLTSQRLCMLCQVKFIKNWTYKTVAPILLIFSVLFNVPFFFLFENKKSPNVYVYKGENYQQWLWESTTFNLTTSGFVLATFLSFFRSLLVVVVLLSLNIVSIIVFRKYMTKKSNLTSIKACKGTLSGNVYVAISL
jgi:hypothetical protein